jgi:type II secretory pathway component PulC
MAPGSILSKIGLRNGDVIKRIGEETIAGPEQATEFLSRLREGGDVTIWVMDKRRSRRIELEIQ